LALSNNSNKRTVEMTYQDPKLPDPGLGRNPPLYRDPDSGTWSTGTILAIVVAGVLILGGLFYTMSGRSTTAVIKPPPVTTGQGGMPVSPPVAPRMIPAPATTPDPAATTKQGQDLEVAPSNPLAPLKNN
jgi:hypothetical protein